MIETCYFCWKKHDPEHKCNERYQAMVQRVEFLSKTKRKLKQATLDQLWSKKSKKGIFRDEFCKPNSNFRTP